MKMKGIILCAFSRLPSSANGDIQRLVNYVREAIQHREPVYLLSNPNETEFHPVLGACYGIMNHIKVPLVYDDGPFVGGGPHLQILAAKQACIDSRIAQVEVVEVNPPWRTPQIRAVFENTPEARKVYCWSPFDRTVVNPRSIGMTQAEFSRVMCVRIAVQVYKDIFAEAH